MRRRSWALPLAALAAALPAAASAETITVCGPETEVMDVAPFGWASGDLRIAVVCGPAGAVTVGGHVEVWALESGADPRRQTRLDDLANPTEAIAGDLDRDGDADLVVLNQGQHVRSVALFENEDGWFAEPVVHERGGSRSRGLALHDVSGDRAPDIVIAEAGMRGPVALVSEGEPLAGPFTERRLVENGKVREGMTADLVGDTVPGAVALMPRHGKVRLFFGRSDDVLDMVLGKSARGVDAVLGGGDVDGDYMPEILVTTRRNPTTVETRIARSADNGKTWTMSDPVPGAENPARGFLADVDGDGRGEVVTLARPGADDGTSARVHAITDEGFEPREPITFPGYPTTLVIGDVLPDAAAEIFAAKIATNRLTIMGR